MEEAITTKQNKIIPKLELKKDNFLRRNTVIYGPSGSGKTVIVRVIMEILRKEIDQILVVAPTEPTNKSYDGYVPEQLIHTSLYMPPEIQTKVNAKKDAEEGASRFMAKIIERQQMLSTIKANVDNLDNLKRYYKMIRKDPARSEIEKIKSKWGDVLSEVRRKSTPSQVEANIKATNQKFEDLMRELFKSSIREHFAELQALELNDEDRAFIRNIDINPHMLLIFDDCAAEMKYLFKSREFQSIFYQGRHSNITLILVCQDDTDLDSNLRKNAFNSIFTTMNIASTYFSRMDDKNTAKTAADAIDSIFKESKHAKMIFMRDHPTSQFQYLAFPIVEKVLFGSDSLKKLCEKVKSNDGKLDSKNPYYNSFTTI